MSLKKCKNVHPVSQIPNVLLSLKHLFSVNQLIHVYPHLWPLWEKQNVSYLLKLNLGFFPLHLMYFKMIRNVEMKDILASSLLLAMVVLFPKQLKKLLRVQRVQTY